jgi:menaquinone reductase, multiheme cytochrome c subunit
MARLIFPEWTQTLKKWVSLLLMGAPVYLVALIAYGVTPEAIRIGYQPDQPVPYSHALHAGELGLDCRYCHSVVERGAKAAIPPAGTCMNCHTAIRANSEKLLPIRQAFAENTAVRWTRVTDLPDYVYFNHSAHVGAGVGCETCHGRIDQMVKVYQAKSLTMGWCVDCHRNPQPHLRASENITKMGYTPTPAESAAVAKANNIHQPGASEGSVTAPTNCSTCHR